MNSHLNKPSIKKIAIAYLHVQRAEGIYSISLRKGLKILLLLIFLLFTWITGSFGFVLHLGTCAVLSFHFLLLRNITATYRFYSKVLDERLSSIYLQFGRERANVRSSNATADMVQQVAAVATS